ncbi:zinc finger CCHC-type and RNA-binding motif-containing protein 1-like [Planococcus citri]|uniref:zinc finger CCHC-type and RNA-binding motif-containing protein 1-like n=1 Tax=Planococcus citri TaxID=170843 RepID=UPI0031F7B588
MSAGLTPNKCTVYVSNLPFSLTNNDLHKIFEKCGRIVKITIMKNKQTRESKGVAFVLYLKEEDARKCVESFNETQVGDRTIKVSIANDNGRSKEFMKKRTYEDKSKCYECNAEGHLSYQCPMNSLGPRQPAKSNKKKKKPKRDKQPQVEDTMTASDSEDDRQLENSRLETLGAVISLEGESKYPSNDWMHAEQPKKKRIKKSSYFSDEEELSE